MQRFDKFLLSLLKTICGLDITELPGCMLKRKSKGKKAKWILHRLRGLIEYDIQQEFSEIVKHSNRVSKLSKEACLQGTSLVGVWFSCYAHQDFYFM
jgi:hypothetical protein